jgi:hypothetical protein
MAQKNEIINSKPNSGLPWILLLGWLLGIYLIATCISGAYYISLSWQQVHDMRVIDPNFNFYPMVIAWMGKLTSGILLLFRSKWLLFSMPIWIGFFSYDFLMRNALSQLPFDFYLAIAIDACILSFVLWMHGRGRLR